MSSLRKLFTFYKIMNVISTINVTYGKAGVARPTSENTRAHHRKRHIKLLYLILFKNFIIVLLVNNINIILCKYILLLL